MRSARPILGSAPLLWLAFTACSFGLSSFLATVFHPAAATAAIAILFCGNCGGWMAFGGGAADRDSAWMTMLTWGILFQMVAPILGLSFANSYRWNWFALAWGVFLPSAISSGVLLFATRSRIAAAGPILAAAVVAGLNELPLSPLVWGLPTWIGTTSACLGWWASRERLRTDLAARGLRCGRCGYDLAGLEGPTCPECGEPLRFQPPAFGR
ncbi:hypothetical protein PHYC_00946 [Phycisphaerales bacterium]|nr:hypothetical protein PHYC_00946 [Phycisphaerales bacterium]